MEEQLSYTDCQDLLHLIVKQAVSDYIHFFFPKNSKQKKALATAEGLLFDEMYYIEWGGVEYSLQDILNEINDGTRPPINAQAVRQEAINSAYVHNFEKRIAPPPNAQMRLDFVGVRRVKNVR